jgi:hypothetical protein
VLDERDLRLLFPPLPAAVSSSVVAALMPGLGSSQGVVSFVLFRRRASRLPHLSGLTWLSRRS